MTNRLGRLYYRWVKFYYGTWTMHHVDHDKVPRQRMQLPPGAYKNIEIYHQVLVYQIRYSRPWIRDKRVVLYRITADTNENTPARLRSATQEPVILPTFSKWDKINPMTKQFMLWSYFDIVLLRLRNMPL